MPLLVSEEHRYITISAERLQKIASYLKEIYGPFAQFEDEEFIVLFGYQNPEKKTFWAEPKDLDDVLEEAKDVAYNLLLMNKNISNIYYSVLPHRKRDFEKLQQKNPKTRGSKETAFEKTIALEVDIDLENIEGVINHGDHVIYDLDQLRVIVKSLWSGKLRPTIQRLGIMPKCVFFTGGGLKIRWEFTDFVLAKDVFDFARKELTKFLEALIGEPAKKGEIKVDTAVFEPARVMRLPWSFNVSYTDKNGKRLFIEVIPLEEKGAPINFEDLKKAIFTWLDERGLLIPEKTQSEEDDWLLDEEEDEGQLKAKVLGEKFAEILKPYWKEGQRHALALSFSYFLREKGISKAEAEQIFGIVLDKMVKSGLDDAKEVAQDRWRAFIDTYGAVETKDETGRRIFKRGSEVLSFGGPLIRQANWKPEDVEKLRKELEKAWRTTKKYIPVRFETLPRMIKAIYEDGGIYTIYFKDIPEPFSFDGTKLIDRQKNKHGISAKKMVNKDFVIKLESFLQRFNYFLIWPEREIWKETKDAPVLVAVIIDSDIVLGIMFNLLKRAKRTTAVLDFEAINLAKLSKKALELAEDAVEGDKPPSPKAFAYEVIENDKGERHVLVHVPSGLLLEAAFKLKLLKPSDEKAAQKLGYMLRRVKGFWVARKKKSKLNFWYHTLNGDMIEELEGVKIEEIAERVRAATTEEFESLFGFEIEESSETENVEVQVLEPTVDESVILSIIHQLNLWEEGASLEEVLKAAEQQGIRREEAQKLIDKLMMDGKIYMPKDGHLKVSER